MKVKLFECPKSTCKYRWVPRIDSPKECPNCKHRFTASWGKKPKVTVLRYTSKEEFEKIKDEIKRWNKKGRWEAD